MSDFDLDRLAERLKSAAQRAQGLKVTVSNNDLMFSKAGYGTGLSEAVPFPALFLRDDDVLDQALTRLGCATKHDTDHTTRAATDESPGAAVSAADAPSMSAWPRDVEIAERETR
jgi:hypothetical protein